MPRTPKTPAEIRKEAAALLREAARWYEGTGADESADALRACAAEIAALRLTKDAP